MTRVHERHVSTGPSAADRHRRVEQNRKASYKVILEEVADKQKRLKTVLYPEQKAPRGYTFIPAGDPQLTNRCKKLAREDGLTVFIVSTSRHPRQGLSREIHRVGFHFPSVTVEKACDSLGVTLSNSGRVLQSNFAYLEDGQDHSGKRSTKQKKGKVGNRNAQPALDISLPQAVIDTSARETIRDLFPNIPNQDLHVIVGRSFQKGKGLVGTVADLSLVRRAQLAVIAHIRHTYTDYDALLKLVQYNEARRRVEKPCLDRLIRWRGDDDDAEDMDDVLREVIVIPDDDDEDNDGGETNESTQRRPEENERDSSVEYISEADMQIQPVDYSNINPTGGRGESYSPEPDRDIIYLGRKQLRHGRQTQYDQRTLDRMGTHRQRVYEEALDRRRKHPESLDVHNDPSSLSGLGSSGHDEVHSLSQQSQDRHHQPRLIERGEQAQGRAPIHTHLMPVARPDEFRADPYSNRKEPGYFLEDEVGHSSQPNRRVYERDLEQHKRMSYYPNEDHIQRSVELRKVPDGIFDQGERFIGQNGIRHESNKLHPNDSELQFRRRSEMVLPSIERDLLDEHGNQTLLHGQTRQVDPSGSYQPLNREMQQLPAPSIINFNDYEELPSSKRRRIDDQQPFNVHDQARTVLVPIEQMDDRRPRYEQPHEAVYRGETGHFLSDKRIIPLPPKEERARSPISRQELRPYSPHKEIKRRADHVADPVDRYPQPRDHFQIPLSRSENVEDLHFPSRVYFAPSQYSNASPSSLNPSQFASRNFENSDLGFPSRRDVGVIANSERVYADPDRLTRYSQPLKVVERSIPSHFNDMSIGNRQREDDRRPEPVTYLPYTTATDIHRITRQSTAKDNFRGGAEPLTAYPHSISERHTQHVSEVQHQPVWPVKQDTSSYHPSQHQFFEPGRANAFDRSTPPPAPRAAMEPWDTNLQSMIRPLNGETGGRRPLSRVSAARTENIRPLRHDYNDFGLVQRKRPDDIFVID